MGNRLGFRWLVGLMVIAAVAVVGVYTYDLGLAHGLAESGRALAAPGAGAPGFGYGPRPWGFGFFPFFPLLFVLFWFVILRGLFWRGRWHGRGYGYGCGSSHGHPGVPPAFDEWHRRAHAEPNPAPRGASDDPRRENVQREG